MYMTRLNRLCLFLETALKTVAQIALLGIMVLTMADIGSRFFFNASVTGAVTIITDLLFPVVVFFSLAYLSRVDGHIRVELIWDRLAFDTKRKLHTVFALLIACFWGAVAYTAGLRAYDAFGQRPIGVVGIPTTLSYGIVCLGSMSALVSDLASMKKRTAESSSFVQKGVK